MIVTINVDASFHPVHKVSAYSFWIVCNQGKILNAGALKTAITPKEAEIQAIANDLHAVLKSDFTGVRKIIVNNDCKYAHNEILQCNPQKETSAAKVKRIALEVAKKYRISDGLEWLDFRYVPAHKGTETKRQWVNDWCDAKAKEQMRKQIKK